MRPPPAVEWTTVQTGNMDYDPVMLVFALLSILSVLFVWWLWKRMQLKAQAARQPSNVQWSSVENRHSYSDESTRCRDELTVVAQ